MAIDTEALLEGELKRRLRSVCPESTPNTTLDVYSILLQTEYNTRELGDKQHVNDERIQELTFWLAVLKCYLRDEFAYTWVTMANGLSSLSVNERRLINQLRRWPSVFHPWLIGRFLHETRV